MTLGNAEIAELLARSADELEGDKAKAARKAARASMSWPVEAASLVHEPAGLTALPRVGPWLARVIGDWLEDPPEVPESPPLRAEFLPLAAARAGIADDAEWAARCRGDLQMHTTYSDGGSTITEMAEAAAGLGHEYIAITDHSVGLPIAGGMDEERLAEQGVVIDAVNDSEPPLRVLKSIEMNLAPDGSGDMRPEALGTLDIVLGSFHSKLRLKDDQTERYLAALGNPDVHVLGHPRGRIFNFRLGLSADWARVFGEAARLDKAVEVDCYPDRQDLNRSLIRVAAAEGCRISLGTDSHWASQLDAIDIGLLATREAGVAPDRILNFMPLPDLLDWVESLRLAAPADASG